MRGFSKVNVLASVFVLCAGLTGSQLHARNLDPVKWSLHPQQEKLAPGSAVVLRLHAKIADGFHLYSFTTPGGGPLKTVASLQANSNVKNLLIYQPKPDRHTDPTFNVPVETFQGSVDFLVTGELRRNAPPGDTIVQASIRYQACSDQVCLPPVTKIAVVSIGVENGAVAAKASIPNGYLLVGGSERPRQNTAKPLAD
jgi:hypothetical protein